MDAFDRFFRVAPNTVGIKRDPFARVTFVRKLVPAAERKSCGWCGSQSGRFRYGVSSDSGRTDIDTHGFCSRDCYKSFCGIA